MCGVAIIVMMAHRVLTLLGGRGSRRLIGARRSTNDRRRRNLGPRRGQQRWRYLAWHAVGLWFRAAVPGGWLDAALYSGLGQGLFELAQRICRYAQVFDVAIIVMMARRVLTLPTGPHRTNSRRRSPARGCLPSPRGLLR